MLVKNALSNLSTFSNKGKMKQAALGYLVQHFMTVNESHELEKVFTELDINGDGTLDKEELMAGFKKFYGADFNEAEVDALLEMGDKDGSGTLDYSEFVMVANNRSKFVQAERMEQVFNAMDVDGNAKVSVDEMFHFLSKAPGLDKELIEAAVAEYDPEELGEVDFT